MRKKHVFLLKFLLIAWAVGVFMLIYKHPGLPNDIVKNAKDDLKSKDLHVQIDTLENELSKQSEFYNSLLDKLRTLEQHKKEVVEKFGKRDIVEEKVNNSIKLKSDNVALSEGPILPVLVLACNRELAIKRSLDLLIKYRPNQDRFPIIVSQDCGHQLTKNAIESYGNQVKLIEQPDLSLIEVPPKEKKFRGYFLIARHYKWAFDQIFHKFNYEAVIVVEDDLDIAPDFYEYFSSTYPLLKADPTLWCISAWNDNGKKGLIDYDGGASILYRTDFFPGLGWMFTKDVWGELGPKWPRSYWDDWMRAREQRQDRACVRPEVPRTRTFGKKGVSQGLFFEKHLKFIHLNTKYVEFSKMDLSYLLKANYDAHFEKEVQQSQVVTLTDVTTGRLSEGVNYRLIYHTKDLLKKITKALGLMNDFKDGVPRTGYRGVVTVFYGNRRIFIAPNNNWNGYDRKWS